MSPPLYLLMPLAAAVLYSVGALAIKRGLRSGIGPWRLTFLSNWTTALVVLPLLVLGGKEGGSGMWHQPLLTGLFAWAGQLLTFLTLSKGDVSVATPLMGVKVLFVALFSVFLVAQPITPQLWAAAAFTTFGVVLLNSGGAAERRRIALTVVLASASAAAFAITDVLIQRWAPLWGIGLFLPLTFLAPAFASLLQIPLFRAPIRKLQRADAQWILAGCALLAVEVLLMALAFGIFGNATGVNVVFNLRGLISVLLVWVGGRWFANAEGDLGAKILGKRLGGALLLVIAVVLVMM